LTDITKLFIARKDSTLFLELALVEQGSKESKYTNTNGMFSELSTLKAPIIFKLVSLVSFDI